MSGNLEFTRSRLRLVNIYVAEIEIKRNIKVNCQDWSKTPSFF